MNLGQTQREFTLAVAELIQFIYASGYEATLGDAYRDPRSHSPMGIYGVYGRPSSAHKQRLAVDLNLFRDSVWLTDTQSHAIFGDYWKSLHPDHRWGGDWDDGNHYSREYGGIA